MLAGGDGVNGSREGHLYRSTDLTGIGSGGEDGAEGADVVISPAHDLLGLLPVLCVLGLLVLGNLLDRICDGVIEDRILHHKDVVCAVSQLLALLGGKEDIVTDLALEADVGDQSVTGLDVDPREVAGVGITIGVAVRDVEEVDEVVPVFYWFFR